MLACIVAMLACTVTVLACTATVLACTVTVRACTVTMLARTVTVLARTVTHGRVGEALHTQTVTGLTSIRSGLTSTVHVSPCSDAARAKRAFLLDFTRSMEGSLEPGEACSDSAHNRAASGRCCI